MISKTIMILTIAAAFVAGSIVTVTSPAYADILDDIQNDISELFQRMSDVESIASQAASDVSSLEELFPRMSDVESLTSQATSDVSGLKELAILTNSIRGCVLNEVLF